MNALRRFVARFTASVFGRRDDQRVTDELDDHLAQATEDFERAGLAPDAARRRARVALGSPAAIAEAYRDQQRLRWLEDVGHDIRYGLRGLRRNKGFAASAILTLALGIGVNSAIFALVDATLLRPLPYSHPDRLVIAWEHTSRSPRGLTRRSNLEEWNRRSHTFTQFAGMTPNVGSMVLAHADGTTDTVARQWATGGFFEVLGVPAVAGRLFTAADDEAGSDIVVLSETLWRTRFNADPSVVGRTFRLDGMPFTVVGIVPATFRFLGEPGMWALDRRGGTTLAIGRMNSGVTAEQASADMSSVATTLAAELPDTHRGRGVFLEPMRDAAIDRDLRRTSWLFVAVVAFVLLMCCTNVANLLLARGAGRSRELAVRSALGAGTRRVVQQLLTESFVLSAAGGLLGAGFSALILRAAPFIIPPGLLPAPVVLSFDVRVFGFCALAAVVTGVLFGTAPAWQAAKVSPTHATGESRTVVGGSGRLRAMLMIGQVAAAVVLLFGAGQLVRTLLAVDGVDRGYRAGDVLTMIVDPPGNEYPTAESVERFYDEVHTSVTALPNVASAAWATTVPMGQSYAGPRAFAVADATLPDEDERPTADYQTVSPDYFGTIDLPVVEGRAFTGTDTRTSPLVCIVNEAIARRFFADRSPVGARIVVGETVRTIVGVARQVKNRPDETEELLQIYTPLAQNAPGDAFLFVRPSVGTAEALAPAVRAAIGRIDTAQVVSVRAARSLDEIADEATSRHRFRAVLAAAFAGVAALLAAVGLFGVIAYNTQQRIRDFGVRRALGATTRDIVRLVAGSALQIAVAGAAIGLVLAVIFSRTISGLLFGVPPHDLASVAFVLAALAAIVIGATIVPALRAARVDPAVALRGD